MLTLIYYFFLQELIPLIICTAMLHPDSKDRDQLLNILFNLIKKPDEEQRYLSHVKVFLIYVYLPKMFLPM